MKKIILAIAVLAMSAVTASAQDREVNLRNWEDFNKIDIAHGPRLESNLTFAFPMYFGWTTLTNANATPGGPWSLINTNFPGNQFDLGKSFVYALQMVGVDVRYGVLGFSAGLRWSFMDFTLKSADQTIRMVGNTYMPIPITDEGYNHRKSKIHATYFGIPLRLSVNVGKASIYAGGSVEFLVNGFSKYKYPKNKVQTKSLFNNFRATVEGGFSYGALGAFVMYGLSPLFPSEYSNARTLTFGILLGL